MSYRAPMGSGMDARALRAHIAKHPGSYFAGRGTMAGLSGMSAEALRAHIAKHPGSYFAGRGTMAGLGAAQSIGAAQLRSIIAKHPSSYFAGRMVGMGADPGMSPSALRALIASHPGSYFAGIRAARAGLGQVTKTTSLPDHTAQDWGTALTTAGSIAGSIIAGTQGQSAATAPAATAATAPATAYTDTTTSWYWPVMAAVGVVTVGGIVYMVTRKPKAAASKPAAKSTANRSRSRKNGWRRKAARGLKGKRRSRSKR